MAMPDEDRADAVNESRVPVRRTAHDTTREDAWVVAVRAGDAEALSALFTAYYAELRAYATSIVADRQSAEDVIQEVFLRVWARRAEGIMPGKVTYYLYGAVRNRAFNVMRHDRRTARAMETTARTTVGAAAASGTAALEVSELSAAVARAVQALPERCREVFLLSRSRRLSQREIADLLGITVNTVNTQLARALRVIRAAVRAFEGGDDASPSAGSARPKKNS